MPTPPMRESWLAGPCRQDKQPIRQLPDRLSAAKGLIMPVVPLWCSGGGSFRRLSEEECESLCCSQGPDECTVWQWRQDKGCFTGVPGNCDSDNRPFKGARKCVPGFCGEGRAP